MSTFAIDADEVLALAGRLEAAGGPRLQRVLVDVVNQVRERADRTIRSGMNAGISLSDEYVSSKMSVQPATAEPRTEVTAAGPGRPDRSGLTILGHYNPVALPKRGGVQVTVTRGQPKAISKGFLVKLRGSGKTGVFTREGGRLRHRYGVSPYSLFRHQIEQHEDEIALDLERTTLAALDNGFTL